MPNDLVQFDEFVLNRSACELRRGDALVPLQRVPLALLTFLLERRGQLVTRKEILERVWGKGVFVDGETSINTAVRKLRRALSDDPPAPRFVATVPARGYRFVAEIRSPKPSLMARPAGQRSSVMVGREHELASLIGGLDDAAGRGRLFLICGEPGLGKTRLAAEVATVAEAKRMALMVGHCSEHDEAVAYLPFVEILESFVERPQSQDRLRAAMGPEASELARLLPKLRNILPGLSPVAIFVTYSGSAPFAQLVLRLRRARRFRSPGADNSRRSSLGGRLDLGPAGSHRAAALGSASDGYLHLS
jgi:DNA-binding winged helix-turn-helix (wHTH) protein